MNEYTVTIKGNDVFEHVSIIEAEDTPSAIRAANWLLTSLSKLTIETLSIDSIDFEGSLTLDEINSLRGRTVYPR